MIFNHPVIDLSTLLKQKNMSSLIHGDDNQKLRSRDSKETQLDMDPLSSFQSPLSTFILETQLLTFNRAAATPLNRNFISVASAPFILFFVFFPR